MIFRQLFDASSSTFSYLLGDETSRQAVLIDCVFEQHQRDLALIRELNLNLKLTLETHVHADHVTGAWLMQQATASRIGIAKAAGAQHADLELEHGQTITVGAIALEARSTPGHTPGCMSYVWPSGCAVFTGDALLIRGAGRTDFQGGSASQLYHSVREQILTLPETFTVYPAHDYSGRAASSIGEERAHNPRLGDGVREQDFVVYMENLGLPHPKKLAEAVPANLQLGHTEQAAATLNRPAWGPVVRTYAGVWQVEPEWVHTERDRLLLIDVRELAEANVSLGSIPNSQLIPLSQLREQVASLPRDRPVVFICPAGARSAIAAQIAERAGIERVANLRGGLLEWQALGLPTNEPH